MIIIDGLRVEIHNPTQFQVHFTPGGVVIMPWDIDLDAPDPAADADPVPDPVPEPPAPTPAPVPVHTPALAPVMVPAPPPEITTIPTPRSKGGPDVVIFRATQGASPGRLCEEFQIAPQTLRHMLSGYGTYKRFGGNEKIWGSYYFKHKDEINAINKARQTAA